MGFISNLINGVKNVSSTVGKVASALSGIPVIGGVASTVANVANTVNQGANWAEGIYNAVAPVAKQIGGEIKGAIDAGKQAWNTGKQAINQGIGEMRQGFSPGYPSRGPAGRPSVRTREMQGGQGPVRTVMRM